MTRPTTDHVVFTLDGNLFQCTHCGGSHEPVLPMPLLRLSDTARGFLIMHRLCPKPETPSPQLPLPHVTVCTIEAGWTDPAPDADPDPEPPPVPSKFDQLYPRARTHPALLDDLTACGFILTPEQCAKLLTVHEDTGKFDAIADWARKLKARTERSQPMDIVPPIAGLVVPLVPPMPEAWTEIVNAGKPVAAKPAKKKRGARPLTSPKARKEEE